MQRARRGSELGQIRSTTRIVVISIINGLCVLVAAIVLQWLIYHDLLHYRGQLRLVGSLLAGALTSAFSYRWQCATRQRQLELLHNFETIAWANDRIRNALQAIACVTYVNAPEAMDHVSESVEVIERVLHQVLDTSSYRGQS